MCLWFGRLSIVTLPISLQVDLLILWNTGQGSSRLILESDTLIKKLYRDANDQG